LRSGCQAVYLLDIVTNAVMCVCWQTRLCSRSQCEGRTKTADQVNNSDLVGQRVYQRRFISSSVSASSEVLQHQVRGCVIVSSTEERTARVEVDIQ